MHVFDANTTDSDIDRFVQSLPINFINHLELCNCYAKFNRDEFKLNQNTPQQSSETFIRQVSGGKRVPMRWSDSEIEALKDGVQAFGKGNWTKILDAYNHVFGPTGRNGRDLKKKWISLEGKGSGTALFYPQMAGNMPPGLNNNQHDE